MKLGTHDICANTQKSKHSQNFDIKFFGNFFLILHLDLISAAADLSRSSGFPLVTRL